MKLYCYPKWSTCKKAVNWLDANHIKYDYIDITTEPPTGQELKVLFEANDYPIKKFFNTSGVKYRELGVKDLLPTLAEDEVFNLLASDGKLIKRPFLVDGQHVLIAFKETLWAEYFENL